VPLLSLQCHLRRCRKQSVLGDAAATRPESTGLDIRTILVSVDVLPGQRILFIDLVLQVLFALLQHFELRPERKDGILRVVFLFSGTAAKPAPDSRHGGKSEAMCDGG
jgi:hypothetical protein